MARRSRVTVEIEEHGVAEAVKMLDELGERGGDIRPLTNRIERIFHRSTRSRFEQEGPGWPPLAPATRARKARQGQTKMLRATDALFASLTGGGGGTVSKRPTELRFGSDVSYAFYHEYGTEKMPQRQLVRLTKAEEREIADLVADYIAKGRK